MVYGFQIQIDNLSFGASIYWASLVAQTVKNPPAMWETWVQVLGWEDALEKGTATHSSILVWTEEPGILQSIGSHRVGHDLAAKQQPPQPLRSNA